MIYYIQFNIQRNNKEYAYHILWNEMKIWENSPKTSPHPPVYGKGGVKIQIFFFSGLDIPNTFS